MSRDELKAAQREPFEAGEYFAAAATLAPAAAALVDAVDVSVGARVLDVGAGNGNVAVEAARHGADVTAVDLSPVQVARGRERTGREGVEVEWLVADAEELPFADGSFTHVLSAFGAVFAPNPERAAAEIFRVCQTGGVVALTAWPDDSMMGEIVAAIRAAVPTATAFTDRELGWGDPEVARARLAAHSGHVEVQRRWFPWDVAARAAAGAEDCGARYIAAKAHGVDLDALRAPIVERYTAPDGTIRADYFLFVARA